MFLVSVVVTDEPTVADEARLHLTPIGEGGVQRLVLRLGFTEKPNVPATLRFAAARLDLPDLDPDIITYHVGRQTVVATRTLAGMAFWREVIFAMLNRNAELTADYFCIPASQAVEIGARSRFERMWVICRGSRRAGRDRATFPLPCGRGSG